MYIVHVRVQAITLESLQMSRISIHVGNAPPPAASSGRHRSSGRKPPTDPGREVGIRRTRNPRAHDPFSTSPRATAVPRPHGRVVPPPPRLTF